MDLNEYLKKIGKNTLRISLRTAVKECPKCGHDWIYGNYTSFNLTKKEVNAPQYLSCNNLHCDQRYEVRGGYIVPKK
ncbi:MAG: hypothetical protein ACW99U_22075 [Candidatus Thorarchaeota archaeon]|jgi:hypothetical protein